MIEPATGFLEAHSLRRVPRASGSEDRWTQVGPSAEFDRLRTDVRLVSWSGERFGIATGMFARRSTRSATNHASTPTESAVVLLSRRTSDGLIAVTGPDRTARCRRYVCSAERTRISRDRAPAGARCRTGRRCGTAARQTAARRRVDPSSTDDLLRRCATVG